MGIDTVKLAKDLVAIDSVSRNSNVEVSEYLQGTLEGLGFSVERLEYTDESGKVKVSLVARIGAGSDGLGLFSHSDTVPGDGWADEAWRPKEENGRLIGLGSCDMKGPLAATIAAVAETDVDQLTKPVYIVVTADEEVNAGGARHVVKHSEFFHANPPKHGVIAEPTGLRPVYAHKGGGRVVVTAHGKAAHTSTDKGVSSNFLIAPFLAEMAELATVLKTDESFMNDEFDPPTLGFNMVLDDGGCKHNVSPAKTVCTLSFRPMPDDRSADVVDMITQKARAYGLKVEASRGRPFYNSESATVVKAAMAASGADQAVTVPYGSDGVVFQEVSSLVLLGPGEITQAHTVGEWIDVNQIHEATGIYKRMIESLCM